MKALLAIGLVVANLSCPTLEGAEDGRRLTRFNSVPGSSIQLRGNYSLDEWRAQGTLIAGFLEVESGFPDATAASTTPARIPARAEIFIPVRNLRGVGESWAPYNEQRTAVIHRLLRADEYPKIEFRLAELHALPPPETNRAPAYMARGELAIAGVTNQVSFPISVTRLGSIKLKISGATVLKQSDFRIIPKPGQFMLLQIDRDPVEIQFDWHLQEAKAAGQGN